MSATGWWAEVFLVVRPSPAVLHFTGGSPTLLSGKRILAAAAALTVTGSAPAVVVTQHRIVQPSPAVLTIIGSRPVQGTSARPVTGALTVTGGTPTIRLSDHKTVQPSAAALTITGSAPSVSATANQFVQPSAATVTVTGGQSVVTASDHKLVQPSAASLTVTGGLPSAGVGLTFMPTGLALSVTMAAPTVTATTNVFVTPGNAALTVTGGQPVVRAPRLVTPTGASLTITGGTPTVTVASAGAHYTDNFNRSDSSTLGANWTAKDFAGLGTQFRILSNTAAVSSTGFGTNGFDLVLSEYNSALITDNHSVSITIGATNPDGILLMVRSNGTDYVQAVCGDADFWVIATVVGDTGYASSGSGTTRATAGATQTLTASDVVYFEAVGNVYTIKKNGSTVVSWTDTAGATYGSHVDSSHRKVAIEITAFTSASQAIDNFTADDI